jgi:ABC-2 type transport system ATP-binding protein
MATTAPTRTSHGEVPPPAPAVSGKPEDVVVVDHLTKRFGRVLAVDDLTFRLQAGLVTGFLGPNGAGKTTTLRMLLGLVRPTAGRALLFGARYGEKAAPRVGAVLEAADFHPGRSGREHLITLALAAKLPARRVDEVLELVELTDTGRRRVGGYSLGMRQRLGLAAALLRDPELLLLDEPANGLDPEGIHWLRTFMRGFAAAGKTVLVSSHVLYEIEALTHNIVVMFRGRVLAEGDIYRLRELIDAHPHRVRVECDRPRVLAEALIGEEHISQAAFEDGAVEIETRVPDRLYDAIPEAARARGVKIVSLTSPDNNLQAVFEYLTENK